MPREAELDALLTRAQGGEVRAVAFVPGSRLGVAAGGDGSVRILDLSTGREDDRVALGSSGDAASSLALSPDGRTLVVGTARGVVLFFELR